MWNRILGKSNDIERNPPTAENGRKSEGQRSKPRRSESLRSTTSSHKTTQIEESDRGFNPASTSYSSTTRNQYPGTASASIGSSYATASSDPTSVPYLPPGLVRNASLADQRPKLSAGDYERSAGLDSSKKLEKEKEEPSSMDRKRDRRERRGTRERDDIKRESKGSRDKKSRKDSEETRERAMSTGEAAYIESKRRDRAATVPEVPNGGSSSVPLDGQYEASRPDSQSGQHRPHSSHIQDQFPGQLSTYSATPYRPPLAASEGGPGLAAEYYGDAGQSVADQPGFRIQSPSLIVGAEPHLQPASAVAAPPPEPSASGAVGAAASFFDGSFSAGSDVESHPSQKPTFTNVSSAAQYSSAAPPTTTYTTSVSGHSNHHSSSAPVIPTLGAAAAGAAAGYYMSNPHSKPERPEHTSSSASGHGTIAGSSNYQQSAGTHNHHSSYSSSIQPPVKPGKPSSQSSNIPLYAAGAAGLAAAAYHNNHHDSSQHSNDQYHAGGSMAHQHRHRHRGPLSKVVDFFKDPEGVAQFEEYTEYIGVCRYCFAPGSSPRDAPRKHHYRRHRSNEKFGSRVRVDKDNRYWSSENESRRRKNKSWLEAGIAGYGLGKMGESLFKQDRDFENSHSVHSGSVTKPRRRRSSSSSLERGSRTSRGVVNRSTDTLSRRSRSKDRAETGITSDGKLYRKGSHGNLQTSSVKIDSSQHHLRHSSSRSRDGNSRVAEAALGAAIGSSMIASTSRHRSRSPKKAVVRSKHGNGADSPELASILRLHDSESHGGRHRSRHSPDTKHRGDRKKEKKGRGFFSFSNGSSSSSSSSNLAFGAELERKSLKSTKSKKKGKESREADAAILGLGAAAAALAFNQNQRSKHKGELIAVKEPKGKHKPGKHEHKGKKSSSSSEEDLWESASESDWSSADSELAYGSSLHRRSRESLSSDSSGLDKWSWRWGSKKEAKKPARDQWRSSGLDHVSPAAGTPAAFTSTAQIPSDQNWQDSRMTSNSSVPLQHVYPMPTSDPTQFDVATHDPGLPPHQSFTNARPDPVPIQHPQPVAPVSSAVYTTQSPYPHSYSAPTGPPVPSQYPQPSAIVTDSRRPEHTQDRFPGAFPTGSEYFESFTRDSKRDPKPSRQDSFPVTRTPEHASTSTGPRRRKSLKDESSSVRFDLTKEQEDKDRREERRRRKEDDRRRERVERQERDERKPRDELRERRDTGVPSEPARAYRTSEEEPTNVKREPWAAPAAAGVIAAAIGATVAAEGSSKEEHRDRHNEEHRDREDRDIEVIVKERHAPVDETALPETDGRGRSSKREGMSVWQAAAKLKRSSSHTEYAAYFTPPELLSKSSDVKQIAGANADNDITVYQVPKVVTVEPSEPHGHSLSRAYSFPITAEDMEHGKKPLPWSVPRLNLVEPTPPSSRAGSAAGSRSPHSRSPLSSEVPIVDIPLEPLESVSDSNVTYTNPEHVEYTVIEPKERSSTSADTPTIEINTSETVPGISSLKNRNTRKQSPTEADYGDDLDFAATVAAGLQDTGFNPSIVIDDPSFRRRDSPPGSEEDVFRRGPTTVVTEISSDTVDPRSPHGFVEEIPEHHIPGSFDEEDERAARPPVEPREEDSRFAETVEARDLSTEELTGPSDNVGAKPKVHSVEPVPPEPENLSNAAVDPVGEKSYGKRKTAGPVGAIEELTEPLDNARVDPQVYTAEPEPFESSKFGDVTIDPPIGDQRSMPVADETTRSQPLVEETNYSSPDKIDYPSDETPSIAATAPVSSRSGQGSKSTKKSKRRSVGFDDTASVISSPATFGDAQESGGKNEKARKGGIFGLFGKSSENLSESKGSQDTPVEANLEDFEEPKKRNKKSKSRKATLDNGKVATIAAEPTVSQEAEAQDDWSTPKKSKSGREKRRSSEGITAQDSGRITQDLPSQVIAPAFPGHDPLPSSSEKLTNLEDLNVDSRVGHSGSVPGFDDLDDQLRPHDYQEPSFLGERPENPPLPDLPNASEDPGGQVEDSTKTLESQSNSPATKADKQKWRLSDLQADGRSVSYTSPSPTAVPLRPLRFGRRQSSPGLTKSLPSTPQPSTTADPPFTPRRRERPHSTEFKSNEFRPIWLLEKHGSRQEPTPQEAYPSLPSSHTTSRASSVHEADDLDQIRSFSIVPDELSNTQFRPEHRGLAIDTSHHEAESELLDSQQATPTAASFQSMLREGNETAQETILKSEQPKSELIDVIPPADAYVDPIKEPAQDERLLHGVDDMFPQHRLSSPSRYDTVIGTEASQQIGTKKHSSREQSSNEGTGLTSMLKDAALGAFIGGSAAALLKSTSQHDEHLEQPQNLTELEKATKEEDDLAPKPSSKALERATAEEMRMMQEQDAQDAVDSWFAPTQPKRTKSKKGKKHAQSFEEPAPASVIDLSSQASNERQIADVNDQTLAAGDEQTHPVLEDVPLTAEPTQTVETLQSETPRSESTTGLASVGGQAALTTRRDSKSKKKKNKRKGVDPSDDKSIPPEEPTGEQIPNLPVTSEQGIKSEDLAIKGKPPSDLAAMEGPSTLPADNELSREVEALPAAAEFQGVPTSTKHKEGKKQNRQPSLVGTTQAGIPEESLAAQSIAEYKAIIPEASVEQPHMPIAPSAEEADSASSIPEEVPYAFTASEERESETPNDLLPSTGQPSASEVNLESNQLTKLIKETVNEPTQESILEPPAAEDLPVHQPSCISPELEAVPAAEPTGRDQTPIQESGPGSLKPRALPKSVPLPLSDDIDLLQTPPDSPIIQPMDVVQIVKPSHAVIGEKPSTSDLSAEPITAQLSSGLEPATPVTVTDPLSKDSDTVLEKAISELDLAEKANQYQSVGSAEKLPEVKSETPEEQPEDEWSSFTTKKSKKEKKGRKNRPTEVETEQELQLPNAEHTLAQKSDDLLPAQDLPEERALPETDVSSLRRVEVQEDERVGGRREAGETIAESSFEPIEEDAEWPTATKKKKKGRKGKKVQFNELQEIQPQEPEASAALEFASATTSTAEDVANLLHASKPETADTAAEPLEPKEVPAIPPALNTVSDYRPTSSREQPELEELLKPEKPLDQAVGAESFDVPPADPSMTPPSIQVNASEALADQSSEHLVQASTDDHNLPSEGRTLASTETTAEIQDMLAEHKEKEALATTHQDAVEDPAQPTEADIFAWAPKKKKKGKKSKSMDDAASATAETSENVEPLAAIEGEASVAQEVSANEPVDEFSVKKSKKDKKSKRKNLSRSVGNLQEEKPESMPVVEEPKEEEMTISNDAPSILEKTDQLPSIEMPTTSEAIRTELPFDTIPQLSAHGPPTSTETAPEAPKVNEMEMFAEAPSITKKQDELPSIELLASPVAVRDEGSVIDQAQPTSVDPVEQPHETHPVIPGDQVSPSVEIKATAQPDAETLPSMDLQDRATSGASPLQESDDQLLTGEPLAPLESANVGPTSGGEPTSRAFNERMVQSTALTLDSKKPIIQPLMDKEDERKAKKDETLQRDDEHSVEEPEHVSQLDTVALDRTEEQTLDLAIEAPAKSKKGEKKSKMAKDLDSIGPEPSVVSEDPDLVAKPEAEVLGYVTAVPEALPRDPEAVMTEETAEGTAASEAAKENAKKAEASTLGEDLPAPSSEPLTRPIEHQTEIIDSAIGQPNEAMNNGDISVASKFPKPKRDKKKGKKPRASAWEDDIPTAASPEASTDVGESQRAVADNANDEPIKPVIEESLQVVEELSKSKKDKKKAKKAKAIAFDELEPITSSKTEPQQEVVSVEPKTVDEQSKDIAEAPVEETTETPLGEQPATKKGKKKGKKAKFIAWDEEPSAPSPRDETDQHIPVSVEEAVAEPFQPTGEAQLEPAIEAPEGQATSKKNKKKGKKSKHVALDEEPSTPLPMDEAEQGIGITGPEAAKAPSRAQTEDDEEILEAAESLAPASKSKKEKKKAKKTKVLAWEEEPALSALQEPAVPETTKDFGDQALELAEAPKTETPKGVDEPTPSFDLEPRLDEVVPEKEASQTKPFTEPAMTEDIGAIQEVTHLPTKEISGDEDRLPAGQSDPHTEPTTVSPTGNVEIIEQYLPASPEDRYTSERNPSTATRDEVATLEPNAVISAPSQQTVEDLPYISTQASDVKIEPTPAPSTDDALTTAEEVIPPPSAERVEDASPLPNAAVNEPSIQPVEDLPNTLSEVNVMHREPVPASSLGEALKVTEEVIPPPLDEKAGHPSPVPGVVMPEHSELASAPTLTDALETAEEVIPSPSNENFGSQSPMPDIAANEPPESARAPTMTEALQSAEEHIPPSLQEQVVLDTGLAANIAEQPADFAPVPEAENVDFGEELPLTSKNGKRTKEVMPLEDEAAATTQEDPAIDNTKPPIEPESDGKVLDRAATEEQPLSAKSIISEAVDEIPSTSRKDKKKAKRDKKALAFDEEPSESTTLAEPEPLMEVLTGEPISPGKPSIAEAADQFPSLSKKDKKKAKKAKRSLAWEDEPSESATPAEPDPAIEHIDKTMMKQNLPAEATAADAAEDLTSTSKKDKKSKKKKKVLAFEEEPSGTATSVTPVSEVDVVDQAAEESSIPVEPSAAGAVENILSMSKKEKKKAKKNKKGFTFDEEPSEAATPVEPDPLVEVLNEVTEGTPLPAEPGTTAEEFPTVGKEKKMGKKGKKGVGFDDEPSESTTLAEPDTVPAFIEDPSLPAESSVVPAIDDAQTMSKKDKKKAKKAKKAFALEDNEPSGNVTPMEQELEADIMDQTAEGLPLQAEASAEDTVSMSRKEKKKAKKGKKAFTWENEGPEIAPAAEEAGLRNDQSQAAVSTLPSMPESDRPEKIDAPTPEDNLLGSTASTEPIGTGTSEREVTPKAELDLLVGSKKGKKDKKKAKKAQSAILDDEGVITEAPSADFSTDSNTALAEVRDLESVRESETVDGPEQATRAAAQSYHEETEQIPIIAPASIEHELAPRHQDPAAAVEIAERSEPTIPSVTEEVYDRPDTLETAISPPPESSFEPRTAVDASQVTQESTKLPSSLAEQQETDKTTVPTAQETPISQDDDFASFAITKMSKKGKKAKKQLIVWEDDTATHSEPMPEVNRTVDDIPAPVRPEMAAWPTEVRRNQTEEAIQSQEQPGSSADVVHDPAGAGTQSPILEPLEPPLVTEERSDYFGISPNREELIHSGPLEDEANISRAALPSDVRHEDSHPKAEAIIFRDETSAMATQPEMATTRDETLADTAEPSRPQDVAAEPSDDFEDFVSKKKDKKSKRKQKKQVVDDVMWEFPSMSPQAPPPEAEEIGSKQALSTNEPISETNLHKEAPAAPPTGQRGLVGPEIVPQDNLPPNIESTERIEVPTAGNTQTSMEMEPTIPEEPRLEEAAEDEWDPTPKKSKKGKRPKKNREVEQYDVLPLQPTSAEEPKAPQSIEDHQYKGKEPGYSISREALEQPENQSEDKPSATSEAGASEAIATAAAMGAGVIAADELDRKESKKGKKNKKNRRASSTWAEPEDETQPIGESHDQDDTQEIKSRGSTPERRRSPIQAWHQYISSSQSPKRSELYEVEDEKPKSAGSTRRKRSYDEDRNQVPAPERRSPIEAWHQYNIPHHSPQQSETYNYQPRHEAIQDEHPASKAPNRDSAVHVSDSPIVPERSPIRRAMRDSGYPDTEASPVVGFSSEQQERPHEAPQDPQDPQLSTDAAQISWHHHDESRIANPLNISSDGQDQGERRVSQSPPQWGSGHEDVNLPRHAIAPTRSFEDLRGPSPVSSTTKDRSSVLFESSPSTREEQVSQEQRRRESHGQKSPAMHAHDYEGPEHSRQAASTSLDPPREDNSAIVNARAESLAALSGLRGVDQGEQRPSLFGGPVGISSDVTSPETPMDHDGPRQRRLNTITEYSPEESPLHKKNRDLSDVGSPDRGVKTARRSGTPQTLRKRRESSPSTEHGKGMISTDDLISRLSWPAVDEDKHHVDIERSRSRGTEHRPSSHQSNISSLVSGQPKQREYERRSLSGASNRSIESINAIIRTPPDQMRSASGMSNRSSGTPPLRRTDRSVSGDLRGANQKSETKKRAKQPEAEPEITAPPSTTHDSAKDGRKSRVREMADVYEGYGDFHGSPLSPTRPPSMRRRQSMQVLELESKLDQLVSENRSLHDARQRAERSLEDATRDRSQEIDSYREGIETRETWLRQKDVEITHLNETIASLQSQVVHLTEVNEGLHATSRELGDHQERYGQLEEEHADIHQRWQQSMRELEALRDQHAQLSAGMEDIVRHEVNVAVEEKNVELRRLSDELDSAKQQIRTLQQQILASKRSDDSIVPDRDEDYFDAQCQSLCQHVQQWVLRFSKFSDGRACYLASEIRDEKIVDRMENAILDGSDPDTYLADRVKRRDVFMSMVMTMTWEFIFTRYLFGADREQRQKLKSLEKQLSESNNVPMSAVHRWRATTLALLSKRDQFVNQRSQDTEAVMHTIYDTLATILPPPSHLVPQIQQSLRKVLATAVDLSIEMRTQRAEYVMLPPLQPEYDTNGDLARKVYFNASLMNERSGMAGYSNEELEARQAVVRMVLFPLVVKKGGDN
ncbi:MAG: hypothetical protein Q9225_004237, partial [Loekoesia sp. 1 TL-2023]